MSVDKKYEKEETHQNADSSSINEKIGFNMKHGNLNPLPLFLLSEIDR